MSTVCHSSRSVSKAYPLAYMFLDIRLNLCYHPFVLESRTREVTLVTSGMLHAMISSRFRHARFFPTEPTLKRDC